MVAIHADYFVNWEWGAGFRGERCRGAIRYSSPSSSYIPSQYSGLKVDEDTAYHKFDLKEKLLCNGMGFCDYDSIEADFAGVFVSWKRLKGIAPVDSKESVLIVTRISDPQLRDRHVYLKTVPSQVPDKIPE
jgi:hypothetical protein